MEAGGIHVDSFDPDGTYTTHNSLKPVRYLKKMDEVGMNIDCKDKTSSWHLIGSPMVVE